MKRSRDDPTNAYSCYSYDGSEEAPGQNLHFVDVGLSLTSPECLVDTHTHNSIVPGVVGAEAIALMATPPPQDAAAMAMAMGGGSNATAVGSPSGFGAQQRTAALAATGVRHLQQRLQPVAKGFPALQFFSKPYVVGGRRASRQ